MIINRIEFKYLVPLQYVSPLLIDLQPFVYSDPHYLENTKYKVASTYFDTPNLSFHKMRLSGHPNGYRIRLRTYAPTSSPTQILRRQLDIKAKRDLNYKESTPISADLYDQLIENHAVVANELINVTDLGIFQEIRAFGVGPVSRVEYERIAFFANNHSNIRITLDSNILCSKPKELMQFSLLENYRHLLELKNSQGNQWPFWIEALIEKYQLEKISFSKQKRL